VILIIESLLSVTQWGPTAVTIEISQLSEMVKVVPYLIGEVKHDDKQER